MYIYDRIRSLVQRSAFPKAIGFVFTVVIAGLLINSVSADIQEGNQTKWEKLPHSKPFWGLVALSTSIYFIHRLRIAPSDSTSANSNEPEPLLSPEEIEFYNDPSYLRAYVNRESIPELADQLREAIRRGDHKNIITIIDLIENRIQSSSQNIPPSISPNDDQR